MRVCVNTLKRWAGKSSATIVFDSDVDPFTGEGFFNKVKGRPNIALVATTSDGDVFGGYYTVAVTKRGKPFDDPTVFAFSFESHGRCRTPRRFMIKEELKIFFTVYVRDSDDDLFVELWVSGEGGFHLGNETTTTFCNDPDDVFDGLDNSTLAGEKHYPATYRIIRLIAAQMTQKHMAQTDENPPTHDVKQGVPNA